MRKALVIALVVLMIVIGVPLIMSMHGSMDCINCGPSHATCALSCSAIPPLAVALFVATLATMLTAPPRRRTRPAFASSPDPPPQLAV